MIEIVHVTHIHESLLSHLLLMFSPQPAWLIIVSIPQNDIGHLMRFIQCSILYGYITDVHEDRALFIKQRTERIEVQLSKE